MQRRISTAKFLLTLGETGALYSDRGVKVRVCAGKVPVVGKTAAGDTFIGYFIVEPAKHPDPETCLRPVCRAAAAVFSAGARRIRTQGDTNCRSDFIFVER